MLADTNSHALGLTNNKVTLDRGEAQGTKESKKQLENHRALHFND